MDESSFPKLGDTLCFPSSPLQNPTAIPRSVRFTGRPLHMKRPPMQRKVYSNRFISTSLDTGDTPFWRLLAEKQSTFNRNAIASVGKSTTRTRHQQPKYESASKNNVQNYSTDRSKTTLPLVFPLATFSKAA